MKKILIFICLCHSLWAHEEGIPWSLEKTEASQIQIETVDGGKICNQILVPGKIVFHPDRLAFIIPKVNGSANAIYKNLGDYVEKGDTLAILESKEMAEAKALYLAAIKKLELKKALLEREESLKGISPGQDLLNARLETQEALIQRDLYRQNLYSLGISEHEVQNIEQEQPENFRFYAIHSPIRGKILDRNLTLGEFVNTSNKIFTVGGFDKVWVEINLSQNEVNFLKKNESIEVISLDGKKTMATIEQFNPAIQEETRRAKAIAEINNSSNLWKVGEYVTVTIQTECINVEMRVPKSALQTIHGESMIFIEEENRFVPQAVKLGKQDENYVEIISGLKVGQRYAATHTFILKAELEKEGAEHNH